MKIKKLKFYDIMRKQFLQLQKVLTDFAVPICLEIFIKDFWAGLCVPFCKTLLKLKPLIFLIAVTQSVTLGLGQLLLLSIPKLLRMQKKPQMSSKEILLMIKSRFI